ncbi:MAG: stage II sporulation protein M [Oscillospiraceae bacterium]
MSRTSRKINNIDTTHMLLYALAFVILLGIWIGTVLSKQIQADILEKVTIILNGFSNQRHNQNFLQTFSSSFASHIGFFAVLFFCGFCAIGQPIIVFTLLFKGLGIGFSISSIYLIYGKNAIYYVSFLILPIAIIGITLILLAGVESYRLSFCFTKILTSDRIFKRTSIIKRYLAIFIIYIFLLAIISLLDSTLFFFLGNKLLLH